MVIVTSLLKSWFFLKLQEISYSVYNFIIFNNNRANYDTLRTFQFMVLVKFGHFKIQDGVHFFFKMATYLC